MDEGLKRQTVLRNKQPIDYSKFGMSIQVPWLTEEWMWWDREETQCKNESDSTNS
jgi:hypothetical protein